MASIRRLRSRSFRFSILALFILLFDALLVTACGDDDNSVPSVSVGKLVSKSPSEVAGVLGAPSVDVAPFSQHGEFTNPLSGATFPAQEATYLTQSVELRVIYLEGRAQVFHASFTGEVIALEEAGAALSMLGLPDDVPAAIESTDPGFIGFGGGGSKVWCGLAGLYKVSLTQPVAASRAVALVVSAPYYDPEPEVACP